MYVRLFSWVASLLFLVAIILYLGHHAFFRRYVNTLFELTAFLLLTTAGVVVGLIKLLPSFSKAFLKSVTTAIVIVCLGIVYTLTSLVPIVGRFKQRVSNRITSNLVTSDWLDRIEEIRGMMIAIVTEYDEHNLEFESEGEYRKQLQKVKEDGKARLDAGETVFSLGLGLILLVTQIVGIQVFQFRLYGYPISLLIEIYLLMIAVSIIYRTSVLEVLSYPPDYEFDSIEEMDVALSYQRAVSLISIIQALTITLVFAFAISSAKSDTLKTVLEAKYGREKNAMELLSIAWKEIKGNE